MSKPVMRFAALLIQEPTWMYPCLDSKQQVAAGLNWFERERGTNSLHL